MRCGLCVHFVVRFYVPCGVTIWTDWIMSASALLSDAMEPFLPLALTLSAFPLVVYMFSDVRIYIYIVRR